MTETLSEEVQAMPASSTSPEEHLPFSEAWYEAHRKVLGDAACRQLSFYVIPSTFRLSVVVPVYNEHETLEAVLERIKAVPIRKEIILVDDYSTDGTRELLREIDDNCASSNHPDSLNIVRVFFHDVNRGKGAAVRTGFEQVAGDVVIVQDADLEYDPSEFPRLLQPIIENKADIVYGSRFLGDQPHRVLYFWHYLGNKFLTLLSNCATNLNLTDMETCYKVFKRDVIETITPLLRQQRFGIEPEITAKVARRNYRIFEMSISYSGRTYEQGKKIGWRDGFKALWCIFRYGLAD